jgi:hypothetical protein
MNDGPPSTPASLIGLVRLRDHCIFKWRRIEGSNERSVEVLPDHCLQCISEARRRGYELVSPDGKAYPG